MSNYSADQWAQLYLVRLITDVFHIDPDSYGLNTLKNCGNTFNKGLFEIGSWSKDFKKNPKILVVVVLIYFSSSSSRSSGGGSSCSSLLYEKVIHYKKVHPPFNHYFDAC